MGYLLACLKQDRNKTHKKKNKVNIFDEELDSEKSFNDNQFLEIENKINIIDEYEKFQMKEFNIKNKEEKTILRALANIGATCYMNATLQCLSNTEKLTNYFLNKFFYIKEDNTKKISNEHYLLLKHLWNSK